MTVFTSVLASLQQWSNPPTNYIGTFIFLTYIFSALLLTLALSSHLRELFESIRVNDGESATLRHLTAIAYLSFAVLSYHMASFLVQSYQNWSKNVGIPVPEPPYELKPLDWMLQSSLFTDFVHDVLGKGENWTVVWVPGALLWTGAMNIWMALEGRRYGVQGLWQYFVLAQILPISFAQNLFSIELVLQRASETTVHNRNQSLSPGQEKQKSVTARKKYLDILDALYLATLVYMGLYRIGLLQKSSDMSQLMGNAIVVRALLFAPWFLTFRAMPPSDETTAKGSRALQQTARTPLYTMFMATMAIPAVMLIGQAANRIPANQYTALHTWQGLNSGMAVRALACDSIIGTMSFFLTY
ncbi:hypothetical protein NA57DRAFT_76482 [Rhizodiscina lignyota]|uniref:Uncharacterized protein n=1 Tax=Rhizodiscina lignyota TaxID=1504668 RepID=A0A9P4I9H3_9PEZI|nr:hypothetical protein NA57DRAFT_76482 [Rhizodiscina lignyota]